MIAKIVNVDQNLYVYPSSLGRVSVDSYLLPYNIRGYTLEHGDIVMGDVMLSEKQYQRDRFRIDEVYYVKDVVSLIDILEGIVIDVVNNTSFFNETMPLVTVEKLKDGTRKRECVMVRSIMAYMGHLIVSGKSRYFTEMMNRYGLLRSTAYNGIKKIFNYLDIDPNTDEAILRIRNALLPYLGHKKPVGGNHHWYSYLHEQEFII